MVAVAGVDSRRRRRCRTPPTTTAVVGDITRDRERMSSSPRASTPSTGELMSSEEIVFGDRHRYCAVGDGRGVTVIVRQR